MVSISVLPPNLTPSQTRESGVCVLPALSEAGSCPASCSVGVPCRLSSEGQDRGWQPGPLPSSWHRWLCWAESRGMPGGCWEVWGAEEGDKSACCF